MLCQIQFALSDSPRCAKWPSGFRPVDVRFEAAGTLLISSDKSGQLVRLACTAADPAECMELGSWPKQASAPSANLRLRVGPSRRSPSHCNPVLRTGRPGEGR